VVEVADHAYTRGLRSRGAAGVVVHEASSVRAPSNREAGPKRGSTRSCAEGATRAAGMPRRSEPDRGFAQGPRNDHRPDGSRTDARPCVFLQTRGLRKARQDCLVHLAGQRERFACLLWGRFFRLARTAKPPRVLGERRCPPQEILEPRIWPRAGFADLDMEPALEAASRPDKHVGGCPRSPEHPTGETTGSVLRRRLIRHQHQDDKQKGRPRSTESSASGRVASTSTTALSGPPLPDVSPSNVRCGRDPG
jgi:hypothetical protein